MSGAVTKTGRPPLIAHVVFRLAIGGMENGLVNLINRIPPDRYRHAVVCLQDFTDFRHRIERDDVSFHALHKQPGQDPAVHWRTWRLLRTLRPDIVHTRNLATLESAFVAALAGVPHRVHGEHGWEVTDLHGTRRRYRWLRRASRPAVHQYVTVSRDMQRWLRSAAGVSADRVSQIYNGVDTRRFRPEGGRQGTPLAGVVPADALVVGTVGRMEPVKHPLLLVRAFLVLLERNPGLRERLRLVMIGDGSLREQACELLRRHDALELAWLPGARDDVAELLRGFDVFALPSLNEGICNTILEAMASGLPVVATNVGGNPELVSAGTGALVPADDAGAMADAIAAYVDDDELRARAGTAARARAERDFGLDAMVDQYLAVYDAVLDGHGRRAAAAAACGGARR